MCKLNRRSEDVDSLNLLLAYLQLIPFDSTTCLRTLQWNGVSVRCASEGVVGVVSCGAVGLWGKCPSMQWLVLRVVKLAPVVVGRFEPLRWPGPCLI